MRRTELLEERLVLTANAWGDFNGDGFADLAVGVPGENFGSVPGAGAVSVIYGSKSGLRAAGDQLWQQDDLNSSDGPEDSDSFGSALAAADFNGDGFSDVAVSAPSEDIGVNSSAGVVHIIFGSPVGLAATGNRTISQDDPGILGVVESGDFFAGRLGTGDFNGDGFGDLAIGTPEETVNGFDDAGTVTIIYGSANGPTADGNQLFTQEEPGFVDDAEAGDSFGNSLAAGDFDGDGFVDLAIGIPEETIGGIEGGAVAVVYGSLLGLRPSTNELWHQSIPGVEEEVEADDRFGQSLAAADFDRDGHDDLAVGVNSEDIEGISPKIDAGAVNILYGQAGGLSAALSQFWSEDSPGVKETAEGMSASDMLGDLFGTGLAAGDFNGDSVADLAVGVPGENVGNTLDAGAVHFFYGNRANRLTAKDDHAWHQNTSGVKDAAETSDFLGFGLAGGDFNGDGVLDLAATVFGESVGNVPGAGAVQVFYGHKGNPSTDGNQIWHQNVAGIEDSAEADEAFGVAVASGDSANSAAAATSTTAFVIAQALDLKLNDGNSIGETKIGRPSRIRL